MKLQTLSPHWSRQAFLWRDCWCNHALCTAATSSSVPGSLQMQQLAFLLLFFFFLKRPEIANKGFVKKPWPVPHQCSPSCLPLKFHFSFPGCEAPCSMCVCGVLCAAAGEQLWVTGAPACLRQHPEQVRACVGVLPSCCFPGSLQFHLKQLMVQKGKERMWYF